MKIDIFTLQQNSFIEDYVKRDLFKIGTKLATNCNFFYLTKQ